MSGRTHTMPRCHAQPGAKGLGQPWWTLIVQKSHLPGKPLRNPRTRASWRHGLGPRRHTGRNPWTKRSAHELMDLSYWLGQRSPLERNTEDSCGSYGTASSTWYTDLGASRVSLQLTLWTSRHQTSASWTP